MQLKFTHLSLTCLDRGPHGGAECRGGVGHELVPPVADVGGEVGDQVHVADDEAVLGQQVLEHGLVSLGVVEHLQMVNEGL